MAPKKRKIAPVTVKIEEIEIDLPEKKAKAVNVTPVSEDNEENDESAEENIQQDGEDEDEHTIHVNPADDEPVEKLLEPFSKEQLVLLVKEAAEQYPQFMENIRKLADADPTHRKIFIFGLGWDTTAEALINVFGKYGEIEDCKAVTDKATGKSKGYAFILFKRRVGARNALKEPQKKIGSRLASCQLASIGPASAPASQILPQQPVSEYTQRKIFISNVSADVDPKKLLEFFSKYGEIEDGPLGIDKATGKFKGFTLFVYKSLEGARKSLEEPHKNFEGHLLHCQRAVDGPKVVKPLYNQTQFLQQPQGSVVPARKEKGQYSAGVSAPGHLMAPSGPPVGFNAGASAATPMLNPAIGQALTALLASQGAGLGLGNLLGGLGATGNQNVASLVGHGIQGGLLSHNPVVYGAQSGVQGGYQNPQIGQINTVRPPHSGPPYTGH